MGFRNYVKKTVKTNTNVKGWTGWDAVKGNAEIVKNFAQGLKTPVASAPPVQLDFNETMKKYGWTEADVRSRMRMSLIVAIVCVVLSLFAFLWVFHMLLKGFFLSALASLALSALMLAYGFREHFLYFQLKQRRLNCTVKEWFSGFSAVVKR
jgi:intracellular multiplication protein IcmV